MRARSGLGERQALLQREREPTAGGERAGDSLHQRLLVGKGEHRLEQEHDVERAGRERRDVRDLEAAGEAGARARAMPTALALESTPT